jgi:hypothetical protein
MLIISCCVINSQTFAQDSEFPKGFVMYLKLHNGMATNFTAAPDLYVGGIQVVPQFTIIEHKLRAGIIAGGMYSFKKLQGQFGPTINVKLKTLNASVFGSAGNINLSLDHLWGTGKEKLIGGGIHVDLLNKILLGITTHREYNFNTWWFQTSLGIRISKKKKVKEPFNE